MSGCGLEFLKTGSAEESYTRSASLKRTNRFDDHTSVVFWCLLFGTNPRPSCSGVCFSALTHVRLVLVFAFRRNICPRCAFVGVRCACFS